MATKFCMQCGGEFIASVAVCPDCEVELVDERPPATLEVADGDGEGEVLYELHEWAIESRVKLEQLLEAAGIRRAWAGTDLVVPAALEARVDALVDEVELTTLPALDPDQPAVAYDITDWSDEMQTVLMHTLDDLAIPYELDVEGELVVLEDDSERVEAVLDDLEFPDALPEDDGADDGSGSGGPEAADVLSDLFVAADRLRRNARDADGVLSLVDRAADAERLRLPYGFSPTVWKDIVVQATTVRDLLESEDADDLDIEEHAGILRDTLRQYV